MNIVKRPLNQGQFYPVAHTKYQIFLHHTAGATAQSAIDWWNSNKEQVGTPYVIDRDGTIFEAFDPQFWAYNLGLSIGNGFCDKNSVPIEIVSMGFLFKEGEEYVSYPLFPNKAGRKVIPADEVVAINWRGQQYYHKYTEAQIQALRELIPFIMGKFPDIKIQDNLDNFWEYDTSIITEEKHGIWSHSTVRTDKSDIVPYPEFISALKEILKPYMPQKMAKETPKSDAKSDTKMASTTSVPKKDNKKVT